MGFSAIELDAEKVCDAQRNWLSRLGPVIISEYSNLDEAFNFLFPVKTGTTRYLIVDQPWPLMISDVWSENCYTDAFAISRATKCRAISLTLRKTSRVLQVFEEGKHVRSVDSCDDGSRWYFHEYGPLQPFEDLKEITRRPKRKRLSIQALVRYFTAYTGNSFPHWMTLQSHRVFGLERCTKDYLTPAENFPTIRDERLTDGLAAAS